MSWTVAFHDEFVPEFQELDVGVQNELLALTQVLQMIGPELGRPQVDTLKGSDYANMKELRFNKADGVWRVAFAFDPKRCAILLVAGDKSGGSQQRFYKQLIKIADRRFAQHLAELKQQPKQEN
jgi:hypothetical protein